MTNTPKHLQADVTGSAFSSFNLEQVQWSEAFGSDAFGSDCLSIAHTCSVEQSTTELIQAIRTLLPNESLDVRASDDNMVRLKSANVFLVLNLHRPKDTTSAVDPWASGNRTVHLNGYGQGEALRVVLDHFQAIPDSKERMIVWNYMNGGRRQEMMVYVDEPQPTPDAFYPYIEGGLDAYFRRYAESNASVLLLRGEPGTGKTSFIRNLIWKSALDAMITYEEQLYQTDEMFVAFMTNPSYDLLVMEDADQMLVSREADGNKIMAKFLNVADGLIRLPTKKIVISSNVMEERKMDSALLRPGRCFDRPFFRKLTGREAAAAAESVGKTFDRPLNGEYTLAEVLNPPARAAQNKVFGFTASRERAVVA